MNDQTYPQDQYFTPGGYRKARQGLIAMIFVPIMVRIGQNWYAKTGDLGLAARKAALVVWGWKAWVFGWLTWIFLEMAGGYWATSVRRGIERGSILDIQAEDEMQLYNFLVWTVALIPLLLVYPQLVDKSLFQERFLYRILSPFHKLSRKVPWPVLLTAVLIPAIYAIQVMAVATQVPETEDPPPVFVGEVDVPGEDEYIEEWPYCEKAC